MAEKGSLANTTPVVATATDSSTPLLLTAAQAARLCNTSLRTWRTRDAAGKIPSPLRIGRSTYWRPEELKAWVDAGCPDRIRWKTLWE